MTVTVTKKDIQKRELFLDGNILKGVLMVCMPMVAFQLLNQLFRVFDLAITAHINLDSVAAVSFFNQLNNSVTAVGTGLSIGAGILIAGYYGAGDYESVKSGQHYVFCVGDQCRWIDSNPHSDWEMGFAISKHP